MCKKRKYFNAGNLFFVCVNTALPENDVILQRFDYLHGIVLFRLLRFNRFSINIHIVSENNDHSTDELNDIKKQIREYVAELKF